MQVDLASSYISGGLVHFPSALNVVSWEMWFITSYKEKDTSI